MNSTATLEDFTVSDVLRAFSAAMQTPVIIILIIFIIAAVFLAGWLIGEGLSERRKLKVDMPALLENIRHGKHEELESIIEKSGLLKRQRVALVELIKHEDFTPLMREALAINLLEKEKARYDFRVKLSDMLAKLAPMFGLLGTLIPLGPGIVALGEGDTFTLSNSLLIAFDTTVAGLIAAAAALVVTAVRKSWYNRYIRDLDTVAECILEMEKNGEEA